MQTEALTLPGKRVFVTGASGFIGSVVVRMLATSGAQVRCLLRPSSKTDRLAGIAFERAEGDVRDEASLRAGIGGCDHVIHLAGLSSWNEIDSPAMGDVTEGGTRNVLMAARAAGVKKIVYASSVIAVAGSEAPKVMNEDSKFELDDKELSYCRHKRAAEEICRRFAAEGLPVVIVNPAEVYGPNDTGLVTAGTLVDFAKSSPVLVCTGGTSVVHVDDVALGFIRALERGRSGERYLLGGDNLTIKQLAELTLELLGQKKRIMTLPNSMIRGVAKGALALHVPLPFNPRSIPYATRYWFIDASKAKKELGVNFRAARDVLGPTLSWLKETGRIS